MGSFLIKVLVSALVVAGVSTLARRSSTLAALLASLPLTSLLAFVWMNADGSSAEEMAQLSEDILWMVLPSLLLFLALPRLLRAGWGFWPSLSLSAVACAGAYAVLLWLRLPRS